MKHIIAYLVAFFSFASHASADEMRGVHISATGNNKYECAIRANIEGMQRSLALAADKIGIKNSTFADVPYQELKDVFKITETMGENAFDEQYEADVTYSYDNLELNNLILKYGKQAVQDQFFEYIIIPVFKQKNIISFLDTKTEWLEAWIDNVDTCSKHRLLPIDPTKMSSNITTSNILSTTYEKFLKELKIKRFKKILLASCEYFTRSDGSMYFSVITEELTPFTRTKTETKYDIETPYNAKDYFDMAIERIINKYGRISHTDMQHQNITDVAFGSERILPNNPSSKAGSVLDALLQDPKKSKNLNKIEMRADIFSHEALESLRAKLSKIKEIVKFQIHLDDNKQYIVVLYTDLELKDLAEWFYVSNLSFRVSQDGYVIFELETGI